MISIAEAMDDEALFGPSFTGPSWNPWRAVLKAAHGDKLSAAERKIFRELAGDRELPRSRVRELWIIAGRRAGKDSIASLIAAFTATFGDYSGKLRPGERALIMCLAVDRNQAKIVKNYAEGYFAEIPMLQGMITRRTDDGFELNNGTEIAIGTNSFRSVRGRSIACAIFDELAYWRDELSATPDKATYDATLPGLSTLNGMLVGISSPYRRGGLLYDKYRKHYGQDGDVLVIKAPSLALNPTLDPKIVQRALEDDPEAASAEWLAEFRSDIAAFISREVVEACVQPGRHELPPLAGERYFAHVDPSGGSADSYTLAITHFDRKLSRAVLDAVRERKPPFSPEEVTWEFAQLLKTYRVHKVVGDRYGGEFPRELFRKGGITYELSDKVTSDYYLELLPLLNSGRVELLEEPRLLKQLCALERRTSRSGKDSIAHPPGGHDDICTAVAGALVRASGVKTPMIVSDAVRAWARTPRRDKWGRPGYPKPEKWDFQ